MKTSDFAGTGTLFRLFLRGIVLAAPLDIPSCDSEFGNGSYFHRNGQPRTAECSN
ncbi:hypothetical protein [Methanosarcina horonobensis]|uniref:hypothetical protein n=1 Tax=Methanosarcina horonobensis TaxID=418008 RepID=UPI0022B85A23|nr:hypothetical protein [Methanosarcina horonobensis]